MIEKPILNIEEQIHHLQEKGIKFEKMSVEDAKQYLRTNNNFFKLCAYRKNFPKYLEGKNIGKYMDLDFAALKDLAIIDMCLRYVLIHMALDVEHFAKVRLLDHLQNSENDGYQIVTDYRNKLQKQDEVSGTHHWDQLNQELSRNRDNAYCGGIVQKYSDRYPAWAFLELIPFGTFIHFYQFCANTFDDKEMKDDFYILRGIKSIRNAAAHSNCILYNMGAEDSTHKTNYEILRKMHTVSKNTLNQRLKNARTQDIITLMYAHQRFVVSEGVRDHQKKAMEEFCQRMYKHSDLYRNNQVISSTFDFLKLGLDIFMGK